MLRKQDEMILSEYSKLYDIVVPKDNELRKLKELVDFSFIYDELTTNYSINHGRAAIDPIRMFKYLLLKVIYDLSDVDIVKRSQYDMSFKFFFDWNIKIDSRYKLEVSDNKLIFEDNGVNSAECVFTLDNAVTPNIDSSIAYKDDISISFSNAKKTISLIESI